MTTHIPKISTLSSRIIRLLGCNPGPMTLKGTNTYIIGTGKKRVLLDTGEDNNKEYLHNLSHVLKENNIKLHSIIITHWHHDHIGGLKGVLETIPDYSGVHICKFPRTCPSDDTIEKGQDQLHALEHLECISVDGATLKVHHTPGHTTDHIVLYLAEENAVFSGDCILGEGTAVFEDLHDYMESLQTILDISPTIIYPGHGPVIESPVEKIQYYIDHRNEREEQILNVFKTDPSKAFTDMDVVEIVYTETPRALHAAAASNVSHHLQKLCKEGLLRPTSVKGQFKLCINNASKL